MKYPISTGQAARFLHRTEPELAEAVRRGLVHPAPPVRAGRRLWDRHHVRQAAAALGIELTDEQRIALGEEVSQ